MPEISRTQLLLYAVLVCAIVWLGARYLNGGAGSAAPVPAGAARPGAGPAGGLEVRRQGGGRVTVHVAGAVRRPGVYRLPHGARVEAAVESAGGPTRGANLDGLNLAGEVQDGRQIVVPRRVARGAGGAGGPVATTPGAPGEPIDLNLATLEQLDTLDGVGPATAKKILDFREEKGGFGSVEELAQVPGIGEKRMAVLREQVRV